MTFYLIQKVCFIIIGQNDQDIINFVFLLRTKRWRFWMKI